MKRLCLIALMISAGMGFAADGLTGWPRGCEPSEVGRRIAEQFLSSSPECYRPRGYAAGPGAPRWAGLGYGDLNYPVANLWNAALEFARLAGDCGLEQRLTARFEPYLTTRKFATERIGHVDHDVFGAVPLEIAILNGDTRAAALGLGFADRQWNAPKKDEAISNGMFGYEERLALHRRGLSPQTRFWIDDMFMINSLQTQAYRLTGDRKYVDRAAAEMCEYIDRLQLANGLFYHAADVPFVWGRGAGWMAAGMPLILKHLPDDSPHRAKILMAYRKMMTTLLKLQRTSGLWGQLVDDPESWDETSGSAMFAYGMAEGVRQGWLDAAAYAPAVRRAWIGLCAKLDEWANLKDVCIGTNKFNDRDYYLKRPCTTGDPHGQAPMLWCCAALIGGEVKVAKPKTPDVRLGSAVRFLGFLPRRIHEVPGDDTVAYYGTGEAGHWSVQCNQQVACALACLSEVPAGELGDAGATMTADEMRRLAVRLFRYSFRTHLTGDLKCTDGSAWGHHWISVLGIERATPGLNILKKKGFTDEDLRRLRTIMESECDYRLKEYPIECAIDNFQWKNKPESNIWNGGVMLRAAAEYPDAVNAEGWVKKGERMLFNGLTVPSDSDDSRFVGANFTPNWSLDHHGYMNAGYSYVCLSNLGILHFNFKDLGAKPPELLYRNVGELWKRLKLMTFDDGRLFRVGGDSRVRWTYCQLFAMQGWAFIADVFGDADALRFEEGVVGMLAAEQSYGNDGSFYGLRLADLRSNSPTWADRLESDAFYALAVSDRWHRKHLKARSTTPVACAGEAAWSDDFHQAALIRSPESLRSVCLRAATRRACALCVPADRSDLAEWQCNLFGFVGGNIVADYTGNRAEQDAKTRLDFFSENGRTGFVWRCDAPLTETSPLAEGQKPFVFARREATVTALADGRTLRVADKVTLVKDTTLSEGFRALHLQVPNDWPNGCFRNYYTKDGFWQPALAFDDGTLKDELIETGKRELMIDGRLRVRLLRGADLKILRHARRNIEVSWKPRLRGSRTDEVVSDCALGPLEKRAGEVLYDVEYEVSVVFSQK